MSSPSINDTRYGMRDAILGGLPSLFYTNKTIVHNKYLNTDEKRYHPHLVPKRIIKLFFPCDLEIYYLYDRVCVHTKAI